MRAAAAATAVRAAAAATAVRAAAAATAVRRNGGRLKPPLGEAKEERWLEWMRRGGRCAGANATRLSAIVKTAASRQRRRCRRCHRQSSCHSNDDGVCSKRGACWRGRRRHRQLGTYLSSPRPPTPLLAPPLHRSPRRVQSLPSSIGGSSSCCCAAIHHHQHHHHHVRHYRHGPA